MKLDLDAITRGLLVGYIIVGLLMVALVILALTGPWL